MTLREEAGDERASVTNIRGTSIIVSLMRDEIVQVSRLAGGENFVSKRNQFILYALLKFQGVKNRQHCTMRWTSVTA